MNDDCRIFLRDVPERQPAAFAVFLSGSGSNAERLLRDPAVLACAVPRVLVTDAPRRSRAAELGKARNAQNEQAQKAMNAYMR